MPRTAGDTRSKGSASRPNPKKTTPPKQTPKPPPSPGRRSATTPRPRPGPPPTPPPRKPSSSDAGRDRATAARNPNQGKKPTAAPKPTPRPTPTPPLPKAPAKPPATGGSKGGKLPGGKAERNFPIHPLAAPLDLHGKSAYTPGRLRRIPQKGESHVYEFHFLYNPSQVNISTGVAIDATFDPTDVGTNYASASQTISFDLLLNRTYEMSVGQTYGMRPDNPHRYGTIHDTEFLYRIANGDPQKLYADAGERGEKSTFSDFTADIGFLYANPVEVHFGPAMRFVGIINTISVQHKSFNHRMIPLISEVSISMSRLTGKGVQTRASNQSKEEDD